MSTDVDVAIVGGGLVGGSLALALSGHGLRIALVEAIPPRQPGQPSYDDRTLALSLASCRIFQAIGLWQELGEGVTPIREVRVSERGRFGTVVLRAEELGQLVLGHVVEARVIGRAVGEKLPGLADVAVYCPARVANLERREADIAIDLDGESGRRRVTTRLLVGADGTRSTVRDWLGLEALHHDYGQTAVIANVTPEDDHRNRAFERFTGTGPLALLPHVGRRCGVVWTVRGDQAQALLERSDREFLDGLQQRFGYALGRFTQVGRRSSYPLHLVYAERQVGHRALILGNAAHTIHPVSAQGFNLGLRDVAELAEGLVAAAVRGDDPGDPALLATYAAHRRRDHQRMIAYTDGLARGFAQAFPPLEALRLAGRVGLQHLPGLRGALARRTMGFGGRVPRLARGLPLGVP